VTPETGELANVDDAASLAVAIEKALTRKFDGQALRRYAVGRFGVDAAADRLGQLYARVLGTTPVGVAGAVA
jgi:hypothetical protein